MPRRRGRRYADNDEARLWPGAAVATGCASVIGSITRAVAATKAPCPLARENLHSRQTAWSRSTDGHRLPTLQLARIRREAATPEQTMHSWRSCALGALAGLLLAAAAAMAGQSSLEQGLAAYHAGDFAGARRVWLPLAEAGDPVAQNNLGSIAGRAGPLQDLPAALQWYTKAAAAGYAIAQFNLGAMYEKGQGVAQNFALARRWYGAAAAQGDPEALTNLGLLQFRGQGGAKDAAAAAASFAKAAELGSVKAEFDLGTLYDLGGGVAADPAKAASWYRRAAERAYAPALASLGLLYAKGTGVRQDFAEAAELFRRAAEQGDMRGQYFAAIGYRHGAGVRQDKAAALFWFILAAAQGQEDAARQRDELTSSMSRDDVEAALRSARKWHPRPTPSPAIPDQGGLR